MANGHHARGNSEPFPLLTLAQILDALSFYLDHQVEINVERLKITAFFTGI